MVGSIQDSVDRGSHTVHLVVAQQPCSHSTEMLVASASVGSVDVHEIAYGHTHTHTHTRIHTHTQSQHLLVDESVLTIQLKSLSFVAQD